MQLKIGNIYWLTPEGNIPHPCVIVELNNDNTVKVCAITTNKKKINMPGIVVLEAGEGNLPKQSIVEVYKEFKISKDQLNDFIGSLKQKRIEEILKGINFIKRSFRS